MYRRVSLSKLEQVRGKLEIRMLQALRHISESPRQPERLALGVRGYSDASPLPPEASRAPAGICR